MVEQRRWNGWTRALLIPLTILAWLAVLVIVAWLLSHVAKALLTLVLSAVLAFALAPLVGLLARFMPKPLAVGVAYVAAFTAVFVVIAVLVATGASELTVLVQSLPRYSDDLQSLQPRLVQLLGPFGITDPILTEFRSNWIKGLEGIGTQTARDALSVLQVLVGTLVDAVLIVILSIYLTANGPRLARWLREQSPASQRSRASMLIGIVNHVVGGYVRGQLTLALLVGVLVGAGMGVLQVRYAVLLGILAFFFEFVPIIGVFVSGVLCVGVALTQGWLLALVVLAYFVIIHVIEGDLIGPRIMGQAVGIHPAVALIALVAGTELFGIWGALLGAPIAGLIQAIVTAVWREVRDAHAHEFVREVAEEKKREAQATSPRRKSA